MTADVARPRLITETHAAATESALRATLGDSFGGAWFDANSAQLVVGVTDASKAAAVTAAGAQARTVALSESALTSAQSALSTMAVPSSVTASYVDVATNSVVVEVNRSLRDAATENFLANAQQFGVPVRVSEVDSAAVPLYNVRGGDAWYTSQWRCSVGFSARTSSGAKAFVTAGHCTQGGGTAYGYNRVTMGSLSGSTFGYTGDFGKVSVTSSSWTLTPYVNHYNGTNITVKGHTEAATGSTVCRSGSTTGWHCGTIQAKNQTVYYQGGPTVTGLTKTSVCAEPGDSGGSFITGTGQAQGVTSGGSGNCTSGGTTYFQPVNEALSAYGLTLVTG